jgi:hypothetical protein
MPRHGCVTEFLFVARDVTLILWKISEEETMSAEIKNLLIGYLVKNYAFFLSSIHSLFS